MDSVRPRFQVFRKIQKLLTTKSKGDRIRLPSVKKALVLYQKLLFSLTAEEFQSRFPPTRDWTSSAVLACF